MPIVCVDNLCVSLICLVTISALKATRYYKIETTHIQISRTYKWMLYIILRHELITYKMHAQKVNKEVTKIIQRFLSSIEFKILALGHHSYPVSLSRHLVKLTDKIRHHEGASVLAFPLPFWRSAMRFLSRSWKDRTNSGLTSVHLYFTFCFVNTFSYLSVLNGNSGEYFIPICLSQEFPVHC